MKKWILLALAIIGCIWAANWSYHLLDHAFLITDYEKAQADIETWGLVNFAGEKPIAYAFTGSDRFWGIFKGLWPVWGLFVLVFLCLTPLASLIYQSIHDHQILQAQQGQKFAENRAQQIQNEAAETVQKIREWAEQQISEAYETQKAIIEEELQQERLELQSQQNELAHRENNISVLEQQADAIQSTAQETIELTQLHYQQELKRFEREIAQISKSRDNAMGGYQRLKQRLEALSE